MEQLNLPPFEANIKKINGMVKIMDVLRKKFVALTPEEWVRQHFIHYLIEHKGYSSTLMANEVSLSLNGMSRRCDSVLYNRDMTPLMIIEYKAPSIEITQKVFNQISRYNIVLQVKYLVISNGLKHYCCKLDYEKGQYIFLENLPSYDQL
ncbi:MAG: type I restriction enzyme HsdR N-terminal domain-containing protein [Bacteroidaceae bacterium]|nr:type I restriction enzyme HsdR N-terminal domain-containing protein [Bacteroidaceae bacterium]